MKNKYIIELAIKVATKVHEGQVRKGSDVPYIVHPYSTARILTKYGCSDEEIAAGLLHDVVEDTPMTLEEVSEIFGDNISAIVSGCSEDKSLSWHERKSHTIMKMKSASMSIRLVSCADKTSNLISTVSDYGDMGEELWNSFSEGREKQEWYYRGLSDSFSYPPNHNLFSQFGLDVEGFFSRI